MARLVYIFGVPPRLANDDLPARKRSRFGGFIRLIVPRHGGLDPFAQDDADARNRIVIDTVMDRQCLFINSVTRRLSPLTSEYVQR